MGNQAIVGLVETYADAERLVTQLHDAGFTNQDISAIVPDTIGATDAAREQNVRAAEGTAAGAAAGGTLGGALGLLAGIGALAVPGIGPLLAVGPILSAIGGVAAGAAMGGVAGGLVGMGLPEHDAKGYEHKVREGHILLSVHTSTAEQRTRAQSLFDHAGIHDVVTLAEPIPDTLRN